MDHATNLYTIVILIRLKPLFFNKPVKFNRIVIFYKATEKQKLYLTVHSVSKTRILSISMGY